MIAIMLFDYGIMLDMRAIIMFAVPSRPSQLMPPALCSCATLPMLLSTYIPIQTPLHSRAADTGASADARHDALSQLSSSESRCPLGGNGSTSLPNQDMARPSAPDGGNSLNLSVSFPPREYLPFKDEAYKIDLRFDRITPDDIFEIDEEYEADMKRKSHILATRPAELLLPGVPGCAAAKQEVLSLVSQTLIRNFPDRFQLRNAILQNIATGEDFDLADQDRNPMDVVARLIQEDIAVMQQINGRMILSCGAVVSPLGWSGSQKLGMDLKGIHRPVPHFNEGPALKFVTNIFEKGLNANVPLSRANWFIMDTAEHSLFAHPEHIPESPDQGPITSENAGDRLFLRCERQVATRLPECGGVMFSFKTYIRPLKALEQRTAVLQRLLAAFLALLDEVVAYRHVDSNTRQKAISYLQHITRQD
ncbi:TPA: hypothetical protein ACH3X3_012506 [Trebouxia sp. C0006]